MTLEKELLAAEQRRGDVVPFPAPAPALDPVGDVPDLANRITTALAVGGDRLDPAAAANASAVLDRIGTRAILGAGHTVAALAGPTGSGKSSLFNALAGFDVSPVGVRRPTTDAAVACVWGAGAVPLLDWLEVPTRHRTERISELEAGREEPLDGLVLLDMPDHDSRELGHRRDVDRLVELVDLLVWVVDPQKYADAALHEGYLRRLVHHQDVVVVVLNQADTLPPAGVEEVRSDLARLLVLDGLTRVETLVTSARTGAGVDGLRALLIDAVASRAIATARARADLVESIDQLRRGVGDDEGMVEAGGPESRLVAALAGAAGVPTILDAVEGSYRRRAARWTAWPVVRWALRWRPDPLQRLRLGGPSGPEDESALELIQRSSLPPPGPGWTARVALALRGIIEPASHGLPPRWADSVRRSAPRSEDLRDALDVAVSTTDLRYSDPWWWRGVWALHMALALAAGIGLVALVGLAAVDFLRFPEPEVPAVEGIPVPTLLLVVGVVGGPVLGGLAGVLVRSRARARRVDAETRLIVGIAGVTRERVVDPVAGVLTDHRHCRDLLTL